MSLDRRTWLQRAGGAAATLTAARSFGSARGYQANEKLTLAVVGLRGRGSALAPDFARRPDCDIAYLADVDSQWFGPRGSAIDEIAGRTPTCVQDFRRALDDKGLDAVVIATPDHWHALATVLACQAGKHVYVEKPASQSAWEGRQMVAAARRYDRVVQLGTQNRSAPYNHRAKAYLDSGKLGRIHFVKVFNQKSWGNAPRQPDAEPPASLDYNLWLGPAPKAAYNVNHQNGWNHFWRYSGGDIINDGVHQLDLARWMIGRDYPKTVYSVGGRFDEQGAFETPDTQTAVYEFDGLVMSFELTLYTPYMIKSDDEVRNRADLFPYWPQNAERIEIYGSQGLMYLGRHGCGWQVYGRPHRRQPVLVAQEHGTFPDPEHKQDFCDAIREGRLPSADIEQGHRSTLLCHYANISYRLGGRKLVVDPRTERLVGDDEANALLKREYRPGFAVPELV